jgi:hypothetical protein
LQFVNEEFRDDYEVVLNSVLNFGGIRGGGPFYYASENLRKNRELTIIAVGKDPQCIVCTPFKKDMEVCLLARKFHKFIRNVEVHNIFFKFE